MTAVVLNVTIANSTAWSYLTVSPSDVAMPEASNLNYVAGDVAAVGKGERGDGQVAGGQELVEQQLIIIAGVTGQNQKTCLPRIGPRTVLDEGQLFTAVAGEVAARPDDGERWRLAEPGAARVAQGDIAAPVELSEQFRRSTLGDRTGRLLRH